jgi:FkbM family methyltransferase
VKEQIKKVVKASIRSMVDFTSKTRIGRYFETLVIDSAMEQVVHVTHEDMSLRFSAPSALSKWRYETFSSKEPETLEWIDAMPEGALLWDIGANIGLYSVYAAKKRCCKVWAFEPSVFNLELLARNISLNELGDSICIVPIALSDRLGSSQMRMTTTEWGGALSTFGQEFGWDGKAIRQVFKFQTIGFTMKDAVDNLAIPMPDYIKMDVDGLEHFILKGGSDVLRSIKGMLIEVNDDFHEQAEQCRQLLSEAGLELREKRHSEMITGSTAGFQNSFNQIWIRQ